MREQIQTARELREQLARDPYRPRYHFIPPEGFFNDPNGLICHRGRYHVFFLGRSPVPDPDNPGQQRWVETWDHTSSRDLIHWIWHPPALRPKLDGSTPEGIWSGGAIASAPKPTLIYYVPKQGICIATSDDPDLEVWKPLPENPVIPSTEESVEYKVFDPAAWYDGEQYYALVGNLSFAAGHEGDSTSLFSSPDMVNWEYVGPFYQSRREWTAEDADCACPDFFPFGNRYMLLMHGHRPTNHVHYYLGELNGTGFEPELHGRMSWQGGQLAAPESLLDERKRRIMFGWISEPRKGTEWGYSHHGWGSILSLPRILTPDERHGVLITPPEELEQLREEAFSSPELSVDNGEAVIPGIEGNVLELQVTLVPGPTQRFGVKVVCSPDGEEQTVITHDMSKDLIEVDVSCSSRDRLAAYRQAHVACQQLPLALEPDEPLSLRIYIDRSVLEVFANDRQCLTQRIYPFRDDSRQVRVFAEGGQVTARNIKAWRLARVTPW